MYKAFTKEVSLKDGRVITLETGKLAKQADASVVLKMGNTMLLATVVSSTKAKADVDFMPLTVEYKENFAALGKIPGGFLRREGRPHDSEILTARLIDRVLRPLFPADYHADTFVTVSLISAEKGAQPDALAAFAASAALTLSDVPFNGPISEVRVIKLDGEYISNPTYEQTEKAEIDLMVGASIDSVMMVEGEMNEVSEDDMIEAIKVAHDEIKVQCQAQLDLAADKGVVEKRTYSHEDNDEDLKAAIEKFAYEDFYAIAKSGKSKHERHDAFGEVSDKFIESLGEDSDVNPKMVQRYVHDVEKKAVRRLLLDEKIRVDGRNPEEIRPIWSEIDYLPGAHGSAIFTRGETQSLTSVTLGTKFDEKIVDEVLHQGKENYLLHYNFPPFSTGDARPVRGISRREVGHGNLAHRALKKVLPFDEIPYTVRIVSDILESNGSSSMATVCAGTLALMDAGIKIQKPVSGIAMGLVLETNENYVVLSDILGDEDHLGDMDFKVTGTRDGITACQMDIKVDGLSYEVLTKALNQAKAGRLHILDKMMETIETPREEFKAHVPRIIQMTVPKEMIGAIIGPGGKIIQEIQAETETNIAIEEVDDKGVVTISGQGTETVEKAQAKIKAITAVPSVGDIYKGKVKSITAFGAFIEILPGKDGLLHISEIEWRRLKTVDEVLKEGEMVEVKLIDVDKKTGKLKLSRKVLLPKPVKEDK